MTSDALLQHENNKICFAKGKECGRLSKARQGHVPIKSLHFTDVEAKMRYSAHSNDDDDEGVLAATTP